MEATGFTCLILLFLLTCGMAPEVAAEVQESSDDPAAATQEPEWLTDVPAAVEFISAAEVAIIGFFQDLEIPIVSIFRSMVQQFQDVSFGISNNTEVLAHYNITGNSISLFRQVDNEQLKIEGEDIESMDAASLSRFIEINSLHLVTEYNAMYGKEGSILMYENEMTATGLFNTMIEIHLLLLINKASPEYAENMRRYREASTLFLGKILFVLVDSGKKENEKVISFFKLKLSQLPSLAIYRTLDDQWDTLPITEVTVELVQNFCDGFLAGKLLKENRKSEEKTPKVEL